LTRPRDHALNFSHGNRHKKTKGKKMFVWKVETPSGFMPYEFDTEKEAKNYAIGFLSWSGTRYRLVKIKKAI
jgi:hypothetical protein